MSVSGQAARDHSCMIIAINQSLKGQGIGKNYNINQFFNQIRNAIDGNIKYDSPDCQDCTASQLVINTSLASSLQDYIDSSNSSDEEKRTMTNYMDQAMDHIGDDEYMNSSEGKILAKNLVNLLEKFSSTLPIGFLPIFAQQANITIMYFGGQKNMETFNPGKEQIAYLYFNQNESHFEALVPQ